MITQERLKQLLHYDPKTGEFTWRESCGTRKQGALAGMRNAKGYWVIGIDRKLYRAHRLAWLYMTGDLSPIQIDHINTIKHDNRWGNLRSATPSQNRANTNAQRTSRTGIKGVHRVKGDRWRVRISVRNKSYSLGTFGCPELAALVYSEYAAKHFGEFARAQ